jgi:hypothetical protein
MPQSSETVAALASALAKAQAELINPEKSLTATIRTGWPGEGERSFRYAPLSSGLDIVRKTLGQHEIATLQTTAIDHIAGMVNLTTTLAHASGEWIASDWPVCPIAETANPQRMGAALTYARRYALFTLVGIAGEDDLDAPDICMPAPVTGASTTESPTGGLQLPPPTRGNGKIRGAAKTARPTVLLMDESAALRDRLLSEIAELASQDSASTWAGKALPAKNTLTAGDAKLLEDAFEQKLSQLLALAVEPTSSHRAGSAQTGRLSPWRSAFRADRARPWEICGPVLAGALARLAFLLRSVVKSRLFLSLAWSQLIYAGRLDALHAPSQRFAQNPQRRAVASTAHTPSCHICPPSRGAHRRL